MPTRPRVFTIPPSAQFLPTLIRALLNGRVVPGFPASDDPLALAGATLYLPTRRACRLARDIFLDVMRADAAALPRILPIGDIDEDELVFAEAAGPLAEQALDLPDALGGLERRMLLAKLVLKWASALEKGGDGHAPLVAHSPAAALALADDLARLMDDMTTRQVSWDKLDTLVPDQFDVYWQLTLKFLRIAREAWPEILAERGVIEPAQRRDLLIEAETARLVAANDGPVIAAGSTGSMPATAKLLTAIAHLPHGAVVLPGLDTNLDAESWTLIAGKQSADNRHDPEPAIGHPQFAMQALLTRIGIARDEMIVLGEATNQGRERLASEIMRPAAATERWKDRLDEPTIATALADVSVIEAANAEEEALAIAVALREAVETPGKTAALVTPDRTLARRALATLGRWNVEVDDSGGDSLSETSAGLFARLAAQVALEGCAPVPLLALLKHKYFRLGSAPGAHAVAIAVLERATLRGPRPRSGSAGFRHAMMAIRDEIAKVRAGETSDLHRTDPRMTITDADLVAAQALVAHLSTAIAPLEELSNKPFPFGDIAARHRKVIEVLGSDDAKRIPAFRGDDGEALAVLFDEIADQPRPGDIAFPPSEYLDVFTAAMDDRIVRRPLAPTARVRIFGLLEARLQSVDCIVLGGLVETVWPPEARTDPWLSRPMRHELGLDLPERRIGLSAHDFVQAFGASEVVLSRATKLGGAPTVASRFVQRLAAVAGATHWNEALQRGGRYVELARSLDHRESVQPIQAPAPTPPREARPTYLTVTEIEHWLRDPYTIYAKHVLGLLPLDAVDTPPGARDRGTVIHGAIGEFTEKFAARLPDDPLTELIAIGKKHFAPLEDYPDAKAFWWPRFLRIARWFVGWEQEQRQDVAETRAEIRGALEIPLGERALTLAARADRIDRLADGRYAILDYKTGQAPTERQVRSGLSPQLTLEAAILRNGGFDDVPAGASVSELVYVLLKGGDPAGDASSIAFKEGDPDSHADKALARLTETAKRFEDPEQPYRSLVSPMWKGRRYGDYDHLARVKEWSATGGEGDDDTGGAE